MRARRDKDAVALLGRALLAHASAANCQVAVIDGRGAPWASATFGGERVTVTLEGGSGLDSWVASLPGADLQVRGYYIADLRVAGRTGSRAELEGLLIEAA